MSEQRSTRRNPVQGGTVVWGVILIIIAAAAYATTIVDFAAFGSQFVILAIVGLGALLVFAAVIGAIIRAFNRAPSHDDPTPTE